VRTSFGLVLGGLGLLVLGGLVASTYSLMETYADVTRGTLDNLLGAFAGLLLAGALLGFALLTGSLAVLDRRRLAAPVLGVALVLTCVGVWLAAGAGIDAKTVEQTRGQARVR
jgi:hypothetical protein